MIMESAIMKSAVMESVLWGLKFSLMLATRVINLS